MKNRLAVRANDHKIGIQLFTVGQFTPHLTTTTSGMVIGSRVI